MPPRLSESPLIPYTVMWFTAASEQAQYRITFFFGPEPVADQPDNVSCVFNVKKRSWKGGIQVAVEVRDKQIEHARQVLALSDALTKALAGVPPDEQAPYVTRADELLTQAVCRCKLDCALVAGLTQENQRIPGGRFEDELEKKLADNRTSIVAYVLRELDLADASNPAGSL